MKKNAFKFLFGLATIGCFAFQIINSVEKKLTAGPEKSPTQAQPQTTVVKPIVSKSNQLPVANQAPVVAVVPTVSEQKTQTTVTPVVNVPATTAQPQTIVTPQVAVVQPVTTSQSTAEIPVAAQVPATMPTVTVPAQTVAAVTTTPVQPIVKKKREEKIPPIDTLKEEGGNWLLKRVWYEQAEAKFEEIINKNDQIIEPQMDYFNKRNESSKTLGATFRKIGYAQGELEEMLSYFLNSLFQERKDEGALTIEERQFMDLLKEKKRDLEQLKLDLASLADLDTSIDDVLVQVVNQVNKCRDYEKKAWKDFKEIGIILSDKKAKVLFYQIESDQKNIQNIANYLTGDLKTYFDELLDKAQKLADSIVSQVEKLRQDGINIKENFEKIKKAEELRAVRELEAKKKLETDKSMPRKKEGWLDTVSGWFDPVIDLFKSGWNWITSFFK